MTARQDPYRVLGLVPGASPGEIRSAYRRLAKLYHPDAAGDRAVARFLAIQAAYEELLDADGRLRTPGWPARGGGAAARGSSSSPRASRDAWRARRSSAGGDAPGQAPGAKASAAGAGTTAGSDGAPPKQRRSGDAGQRSGTRSRSERRTARPGSTTYDEATQPLDPSWDGGAWYGASSGRYWTINPREYADPRKHGPEYQERARRAARLEAQRRAQGSPSDDDGPSAEEPRPRRRRPGDPAAP